MTRIRLDIAYDGTNYCGWQYQPNGLTIEEVLNRELSALLKEDIHVIGASRTDSGVHAYQNIAVFDTGTRIPPEKICLALNQKLPTDISIQASSEVPADWHPRKRNTIKTYEYRILNRRIPFPERRFDTYYTFHALNVEKMREAAAYLVGEHDFKSFCSVSTQAEETIRTIYSADIIRTPINGPYSRCITDVIELETPVVDVKSGEIITIRLRGNGFLTHMVRIIAGTLMRVGTGMYEPAKVKEMLDACDRYVSGPKAPPQALTLISLEEVFGLMAEEHTESDRWSYTIKRVRISESNSNDSLIMPEENYETHITISYSEEAYMSRNIYRLVKHAFQDSANKVFVTLPESCTVLSAIEEFAFTRTGAHTWEAIDTYRSNNDN